MNKGSAKNTAACKWQTHA